MQYLKWTELEKPIKLVIKSLEIGVHKKCIFNSTETQKLKFFFYTVQENKQDFIF